MRPDRKLYRHYSGLKKDLPTAAFNLSFDLQVTVCNCVVLKRKTSSKSEGSHRKDKNRFLVTKTTLQPKIFACYLCHFRVSALKIKDF